MRNKTNRTVSIKIAALIAAIVLVIGCTAGGTVAWLVSKPDPITNVFTVGNINATLTEAAKTEKKEFKIVPGVDITKDPVATVEANSEDCYLFVQLTEANWPTFTEADNTTRKVKYEIAKDWTKLESVDGVYYRVVTKSDTENQSYPVLQGNKVTVSSTLTKEEANDMDLAIKKNGDPKLTVAVYAVQKEGIDTVEAAWEKVKPTTPVNP